MELAVVMAVITVLAGGAILALGQSGSRTLQNASLQLQADMRYLQRRAVLEGNIFEIRFNTTAHTYDLINTAPRLPRYRTERTIALPDGVRIAYTTNNVFTRAFHPRGTPSAPFTVRLEYGNDFQLLTVSMSGGRIHIFDINETE